jgi:lysophospholipase L1-like esterase
MSQLAELLRSRGIRLTVAVYPWPDQIWRQDRDSLQVTAWKQWAEVERVDFIDFFPAFFAEPAQQVLARYFIPGDEHFSAEGHRLVATAFLRQFAGRP